MDLSDLAWMTAIFAPILFIGVLLIGVGLHRRQESSRSYLSQPGDYACATSDNGVRIACEESARRSRARRREKINRSAPGPLRGRWRRV